MAFQRTSTPQASSTDARSSRRHGSVLCSSDDVHDVTTTAEEDDRIEADQVDVLPCVPERKTTGQGGRHSPSSDAGPALSSGAPSSVDALSSGQVSCEEEEEEEEEFDEEEESFDDLVPCQGLEFSFKVNAPIDFVADNAAAVSDEDEESGGVKRNPKRKAMTITKKRSENVSHKMPNTSKVTSRLADYIKTPPVPARQREERDQQSNNRVARNNAKNSPKKRLSVAEVGNR